LACSGLPADDKKSGKETSCGSYGDIQQWVHQDLMSSINWLQQQEEKVNEFSLPMF